MRYIIGIDLGTTNSCVSYVDTSQSISTIQQFPIPQQTAEGVVEASLTLPSFCYLPSDGDPIVGIYARDHGAKIPTRQIASAKSWLCHGGTDRRSAFLPLEADADRHLSPVEATACYLSHIREAWNSMIAKGDSEALCEEQEVIVTVPASFDEVARALTAEAAKMAGFSRITFLEEPQAAFYAWIAKHEKQWREKMRPGERIFVCDIGGGTTDFSLIEVTDGGFQRMAVGEHLLLGGDNIDLAIAHATGLTDLTAEQRHQLLHEARRAKESIFSGEDSYTIQIHGEGSQVVGGSITASISREQLGKVVLEGFFGTLSWEEARQLRRARGMRTMGLPYEDEPSFIKQIAHFLHCHAEGRPPEYILFNGGTLNAQPFREAIMEALGRWFTLPQVLAPNHLDLAVSRGAAYFGKARRGEGIRIKSGSARAFYLEIENEGKKEALTLMPRGSDEGAVFQPKQTFQLKANSPVSFQLYTSHVRLHDQPGDLVAIDEEELHCLPPIHTVLRFGKKEAVIPVTLKIALTEIGTLELWLDSQNTEHRWSLEFQLKRATGQEDALGAIGAARKDETFDENYLNGAKGVIEEVFSGKIAPKELMAKLEDVLGRPRSEWSPSILRGLWEALYVQAQRRKVSPEHEARWWNAAGYFLRPGCGYPLDDHRVKALWKIILEEFNRPSSSEVEIQKAICYRRIAGGLTKGQQMQLASKLLPTFFNRKCGKIDAKGKGDRYRFLEMLRTTASLERLQQQIKRQLGTALLHRIGKGEGSHVEFWALGRFAARHLLYGGPDDVLPKETCAEWIEALGSSRHLAADNYVAAVLPMVRRSDFHSHNLSDAAVAKAIAPVKGTEAGKHLELGALSTGELTPQEQAQWFGEQLPTGLILTTE
ncbi:MAG: Hsp70 family protein [Chlamydiia bacterium]|nr:Hsp70 family protein [Chlamydiia bacterium]